MTLHPREVEGGSGCFPFVADDLINESLSKSSVIIASKILINSKSVTQENKFSCLSGTYVRFNY